MTNADYRQQQEDDETRENMCLETLHRVAKGNSDLADAMLLASELGLTRVFKHDTTGVDMKASAMVERKFLAKEDLDGGEVIVTIARIGQANVAQQDQPEEKKWAVKFKEFQKAMILNSTNIQLIVKALGTEETDEWIDREIILYVDDNVSFGGKLVGGIRVKSAAPAKAPKRLNPKTLDDLTDDVPFINIGRGISGHSI